MLLSVCENLELNNDLMNDIVSSFLKNNDVKNIKTGRYELDNDCYVNVDEYDTVLQNKFEAHKRFIDVQVMVSGEEYILCSDLKNGKETEKYNETRDIAFYSCDKSLCEKIHLTNGKLAVLMPNDIHAPAIFNEKRFNRKLIFKIPVKLVSNQLLTKDRK